MRRERSSSPRLLLLLPGRDARRLCCARGLDEESQGIVRRCARRLAVGADAKDGGQDVGFAQRGMQIGPIARVAINLEVDEAIEGNRCAAQTVDGNAVLADIARDHGRHPRRAPRILPHNLPWDSDGAPFRGALVSARLLASLHKTKTLFHVTCPPVAVAGGISSRAPDFCAEPRYGLTQCHCGTYGPSMTARPGPPYGYVVCDRRDYWILAMRLGMPRRSIFRYRPRRGRPSERAVCEILPPAR